VKKLLISTLVLVMCLGFGAAAFAATTPTVVAPAFSDIAGHPAEFALTVLGGLGVYSGDSGLGGAVKPDDPITRAQFCKVLVTAMGRGSTAAGLGGLQPTFTDGAAIPTWAWGYVNVAVYMGVIGGYPDGSFKPNNPVTYAEAVTMLVKAVSGHAAQVGPGVWPYNYIFYAVDNGFTGGVDVGFANLPASRGDVARMLYATMQINKLDKDGKAIDDSAVLANRILKDVLTSYDLANNASSLGTLASKVYLAGAPSLDQLLQVHVVAVKDAATSGKIVAIGKDEAAKVVTGVFKDWDDTTDPNNKVLVLQDGTKVPYGGKGTVPTVLNGDAVISGNPVKDDSLQAGDEVAITVNEAGQAAFIVATHFDDLDYITDVTKSTTDAGGNPVNTKVTGHTLAQFEVLPTAAVTVNGAPADRDTLAEYDVFAVALNAAGEAVVLRATRQVVEGTVAGTSMTYPGPVNRVTIDLKGGGTKTYVVNGDGPLGSEPLPTKGDVVKYGLDADGKLFVAIGYEPLTPYAVCTSFVINGDGSKTATFDIRGASVTYKVDASLDLSGDIGEYLLLGVNTATGTVDNYSIVDVGDTPYKVVSVDKANKTMTLYDGTSSYYFIDDPDAVIYKVDSTTDAKVYVGFDGISAGTWLLWNWDGSAGDPVFEVTTAP